MAELRGGTTIGGSLAINLENITDGSLDLDVNLLTVSGGNLTVSGGNLTVSGTLLPGSGSVTAPSHSFSTDSNSGMYSSANNVIGWTVAGVGELLMSGSALYPTTTNGLNLGGSGNKWNSVHFTNIYNYIADTTSTPSHCYIEVSSDSVMRPITWANFQNKITDVGTLTSLSVNSSARIQSVGHSTSWGTTSGTATGALNAVMGTGGSATWLLSGTSGGTFRSGIQSLDSNGTTRIYVSGDYLQISQSTGTTVALDNIASVTTTALTVNTKAITVSDAVTLSTETTREIFIQSSAPSGSTGDLWIDTT